MAKEIDKEAEKLEEATKVAHRKAGKMPTTKKFTRKVTGSANGIPLHEEPHILVSVLDGGEQHPVCHIVGQTVVCERAFKGNVIIEYITFEAQHVWELNVQAAIDAELAK